MQPIFEPLEIRRLLSTGSLDPFYGNGGIESVFRDSNITQSAARAVVALPDGRAYLGGIGASYTMLARLDFDGNPDPTFGDNGIVTDTVLGDTRASIQSIVVQQDDKVVGLCEANGNFALVRFLSDGSLDDSFGTEGVATVGFGYPTTQAYKLLLQSDGRLLAIGSYSNGNKSLGVMARFNVDGTLDPSFGVGGKVMLDLSPGVGIGGFFSSAVILDDGSIVACGTGAYDPHTAPDVLVLCKFTASGVLDTSFASSGESRLVVNTPFASGIIPATDGGYLINAWSQVAWGVVKLDSDGSLDTTWGTGGETIVYSNSNGYVSPAGDLAIQPDGSVVASHEWSYGWTLGRILSDGVLDSNFGDGAGNVVENLGNYGEGGGSIALQPAGRALIVGGGVTYPTTIPEGMVVARYQTMPEPTGATLDPRTGIVTVVGTPNPDDLEASVNGTTLSIVLNGSSFTFSTAEAHRLDITMLDGNDEVKLLHGELPGMVELGTGDDSLLLDDVATGSPRQIFGDDGNDTCTLEDGTGVSVGLDGGAGTDRLILVGTPEPDTMNAAGATATGAGYTATYSNTTEELLLDGAGGDDTISSDATLPIAATLSGNSGDDLLRLLAPEYSYYGLIIGNPVSLSGGDGEDVLTYRGPAISVGVDLWPDNLQLSGKIIARLDSTIEEANIDGGDSTIGIHSGGIPSITVDGEGIDRLIYYGTAAEDVVSISSSSLVNGAQSVIWSNIASLWVEADAGNDTITFADSSEHLPVTVYGQAGNDTLTIASAPLSNLVFEGGLEIATSDILDVDAGTYLATSDARSSTANLTMNVAAGASVIFSSTQHLADLNLLGGDAQLVSGGANVLVVKALGIHDGGSLDLKDNSMVLDYSGASPIGSWNGSNYTGLTGLLASGRNDGQWDGAGIVSSTAAADAGLTTLGIAEANNVVGILGSETATWNGQTIDGTSVLIKYTLAGDANLDGRINIDDYGRIDANVGQSGLVFGWYQGDFNFDGKIDIDDYGIIDSVIGRQPALDAEVI